MSYNTEKSVLRTVLNITTAIVLVFTLIFGIRAVKNGIFDSVDKIGSVVKSFGRRAPSIFILIQIVQVVFPVIPGGITLAAGVIMFGPIRGFVYNYLGICIGSIIVFIISRVYGKDIIIKIFGLETYKKYAKHLSGKKYDLFFALAIFFPVAPDDLLCYISGLSNMSFKKFVLIILLGKPASIFLYSMGLVKGLDFVMRFIN